MADRITAAETLEETAEALKTGIAVVHWCGSRECAEKIEAVVDASIIGSEIRSDLITVSDGHVSPAAAAGASTLVARTLLISRTSRYGTSGSWGMQGPLI